MTRTDFLTGLSSRIADEEEKLDSSALDGCLDAALREYSQTRERQRIDDLTSDGTAFLELPTLWETDSQVVRLDELDADGAPEQVASSAFRIVENPTPEGPVLFFSETTPASGTVFRLIYTIVHTITATSSSVPSVDADAVMDLAASHALLRMAAAYVQSEDQQLQTVTLGNTSKAGEYRKMAAEYRKQYTLAMGIDRKKPGGRMKTWNRESMTMFH